VKHWADDAVAGRFEEINFYTPAPVDEADVPLPKNVRQRILRSKSRMLIWENLRLGPTADEDVLFCPSHTRPLIARGKIVVTTHDATQKLFPDLFPMSARLFYTPFYGWSARHATLVITDSEAGRQDIARCWGVPLSKIRVVYLAPAEIFKPLRGDDRIAEAKHRFLGSSTPFFLFVGKLSGRRNIPRLLEAFAEFKRKTALPHKLLMVGLNIHNLSLSTLIQDLGLSNDLRHCPYLSDDDLNSLYNAAEAFISPAEYETISLPVMEAQATGTPVICIDTGGMREITGEAAVLIPKLQVEELVRAMFRVAGDAPLRRRLSEEGLAHARHFSWARCASETLAVLEEAAHT
jgi:glycosyltransferase involved in cell wall biosynthesis